MIERYSLGEIKEVFTDRARMEAWLEVEVLTVEALAALGRVPVGDAEYVRAHAPLVDDAFVAEVNRREEVKLGEGDLRERVDIRRLAHQHRIEPAGTATSPRHSAEFHPNFDKLVARLVLEFCGKRSSANAGEIGLGDSDDGIDVPRANTASGTRATSSWG